MLVLFAAYGGGVGFSVHNCEHCHQKKAYLFQHPDCCSAAKAEHHHQVKNCENDCSHSGISCNHKGEKTVKCKKNANMPHCQPCCITKFQFYKIHESYFASKYKKLTDIVDFSFFTETASFDFAQYIPPKIDFSKNNFRPPPLLPGGERFIIFSHQLLFYA